MPSDKHNSITAKAMDLIFFTVWRRFVPRCAFWHTAVCTMHSSMPSFVSHSPLLTTKSINFVVRTWWFLLVTEIIHNFHSGYIDCRGSFQQLLIRTALNIASTKARDKASFQEPLFWCGMRGLCIFKKSLQINMGSPVIIVLWLYSVLLIIIIIIIIQKKLIL